MPLTCSCIAVPSHSQTPDPFQDHSPSQTPSAFLVHARAIPMPLTGPSQSQTPAPCPSCRTHASCVLVELSPPRITSPPMLLHPPWSLSCPCRVVPSHAPAPPSPLPLFPSLAPAPYQVPALSPFPGSLCLSPAHPRPLYPPMPPAPTHANVPLE